MNRRNWLEIAGTFVASLMCGSVAVVTRRSQPLAATDVDFKTPTFKNYTAAYIDPTKIDLIAKMREMAMTSLAKEIEERDWSSPGVYDARQTARKILYIAPEYRGKQRQHSEET